MNKTLKLLAYFKANAYKAISLDWLVKKSGKSRSMVLRYIQEVRRRCPRGWRLYRTRLKNKDHGGYDFFYTYCRTAESFRRQQRLEIA